MFCFQCEQTAKGAGCTNGGICGKKTDTANLQDSLTGELIGLARAAFGNTLSAETHKAVIEGLFTTVTNVNFNDAAIKAQIETVKAEKAKLIPRCRDCAKDCGRNDAYDMTRLWESHEDIRSLKSLLLFGLRGMAAYAYHAGILGKTDDEINSFFYKGLFAVGEEKTADELLTLIMELGNVNLKCLRLLNDANTGTYGNPIPVKVSCNIEPGPFIVISGHDLYDLKLLLEQTEGTGVNVYTHSEMLPAHGYPELKNYPHLKGNFGTAWQNQQREFENIPAAVLFTTNCMMPVKPSYADRVFTTSVVSYPGIIHIDSEKDFTPVINKALELGGYKERRHMTGINGGDTLATGYANNAVLSVAENVIDAVKTGEIRHFFLVGGCDGAKPGRNYYTEFVKQSPEDTVILTLACGKYRFNDLNTGEICGLPRLMDMGQCNDAYSAIKVALALAEALNCSVNELPLTLILSWYEQKAVCILLTLLALGIKNIYIGPGIPAFISPNILSVLAEKFNLTPISTPEADLKKILG
ncbi:MAG: hydroxylamine reductase [Clostridiales bacterium]|jgi:hydroxylamine reductase|nr:hydroxylamine reductase [Clostridiales bacterium]